MAASSSSETEIQKTEQDLEREQLELNKQLEAQKKLFVSSTFDTELTDLVKCACEVIEQKNGTVKKLTGKKSEQELGIRKFVKIYSQLNPEDLYPCFQFIFNTNRTFIIAEDESWLLRASKQINIHPALGKAGLDKKTTEKCQTCVIMFSSIYKMAKDLRDDEIKRMETMEGLSGVQRTLNYPSYLLLHLMRIFYLLIKGIDKDNLAGIVAGLEAKLKVKTIVGTEPGQKPIIQQVSSSGGGASKIFEYATGFMKNMGFPVPEGIPPPSEDAITDVFGRLFNNDDTKKLMTQVASTLQNSETTDVATLLPQIISQIQDPSVIQNIQNTIGGAMMESNQGISDGSGPGSGPGPSSSSS